MNEKNLQLIEECFRSAKIRNQLCANSIDTYRKSLGRLFKAIGDKNFEDITEGDLENFIFQAQERGNDNSVIKGILYALKWVIMRLEERRVLVNKINFNTMLKLKIKKKEVIFLTKDEVARFLEVIKGELEKGMHVRKLRTMALYVLLLETGARISEALSIKIKDIDFENKEVPIIGKGEKPRTLFLRNESIFWIRKYLDKRNDASEYLFANISGKACWTYNDVCRAFQRYKRLSGIKKDFSIHTFRHTFATQLLLNGMPINDVSFLLGHANLETTIKYYIGVIKKAEARERMKDSHFDFIPQSSLVENKSIIS